MSKTGLLKNFQHLKISTHVNRSRPWAAFSPDIPHYLFCHLPPCGLMLPQKLGPSIIHLAIIRSAP